MKFHIHAEIDSLLKKTDEELGLMFSEIATAEGGKKVREELLQRKAAGERLVLSQGCDNYNQEKGCLGHPTSEDEKCTHEFVSREYPSQPKELV